MPLVVPEWLAEHVDLLPSSVEPFPSVEPVAVAPLPTPSLVSVDTASGLSTQPASVTETTASALDINALAATLVSVGIEEEAIHGAAVTGPLVVGRVLAKHPEPQKNGKTINWCLVDVGVAHNTRTIKGVTEDDLVAAGAPESGARGIVCGAHNFEPGDLVVVALPGTVLPGPFPIAARKTYGHVSDGMICSTAELGLAGDAEGIIVLPRDFGFDDASLQPGQDAISLLGLGTEVLEINITPDRGYQLSYRGVAREYSLAPGAKFTAPGLWGNPAGVEPGLSKVHASAPLSTDDGFPVEVADVSPIRGQVGCDRFVTRIVRGVDPTVPTPNWLAQRLEASGMRSISLIVDITNYVMLDLGQPVHAYDLDKVAAPIVVRRANSPAVAAPADASPAVEPVAVAPLPIPSLASAEPASGLSSRPASVTETPASVTESIRAERLTTLDGVERTLDPEDLLITDSPGGHHGSRVLGLAGVMGGASSEITDATTNVLVECAHFDPASVARTARRHKLPSEAAKRFERGVDPALPPVAAQRVVDLIVTYAGGVADPEVSDYNTVPLMAPIELPVALPSRIVGVPYSVDRIIEILQQIGCQVTEATEYPAVVPAVAPVVEAAEGWSVQQALYRARNQPTPTLRVQPPTWRPDLTEPIDLVEEIVRIDGYDKVPSILPAAPGSSGQTREQRAIKSVARALAEAGLVETLSYPFVAATNPFTAAGALRLANPLAEDRPLMRTSLLATLSEAAQRNVARGLTDFGVFEIGLVTEPPAPDAQPAPIPPGALRPDAGTLANITGAVPSQPMHVAGIVVGAAEPAGWWGQGRPATWRDALELAALVGDRVGAQLTFAPITQPGANQPFATQPGATQASANPPATAWHPGRVAQLAVTGSKAIVGLAGELHPNICKAFGLPKRTVAFELDLSKILAATNAQPTQAKPVSAYPAAKEDFAFVVDAAIPAETIQQAITQGAGELLEELALFDVYQGEQLGAGKKSLAFSVRLRAADHTLDPNEVRQARDNIIETAANVGATLRQVGSGVHHGS